MSKEQVSGSLTLSLGGLADDLAARLGQVLDDRLGTMPPEAVTRMLTSYGVPYVQAEAIARQMEAEGFGLALVTLPRIEAAPPAQETPSEAQQESAVDWFEREVEGR